MTPAPTQHGTDAGAARPACNAAEWDQRTPQESALSSRQPRHSPGCRGTETLDHRNRSFGAYSDIRPRPKASSMRPSSIFQRSESRSESGTHADARACGAAGRSGCHVFPLREGNYFRPDVSDSQRGRSQSVSHLSRCDQKLSTSGILESAGTVEETVVERHARARPPLARASLPWPHCANHRL